MAAARESLAGRLLHRGEPGYEQARVGRIFNARRPDRFPAAVLLAAGPPGSRSIGAVCGVSVIAGLTALTRMRCGPPSTTSW